MTQGALFKLEKMDQTGKQNDHISENSYGIGDNPSIDLC